MSSFMLYVMSLCFIIIIIIIIIIMFSLSVDSLLRVEVSRFLCWLLRIRQRLVYGLVMYLIKLARDMFESQISGKCTDISPFSRGI